MLHKIKESSDINDSKLLLSEFRKSSPNLYGKGSQTFTLHTIVKHLYQDAERHGSLCEHSIFTTKSSLGHYQRSIKGNRGISSQYLQSEKFLMNIY